MWDFFISDQRGWAWKWWRGGWGWQHPTENSEAKGKNNLIIVHCKNVTSKTWDLSMTTHFNYCFILFLSCCQLVKRKSFKNWLRVSFFKGKTFGLIICSGKFPLNSHFGWWYFWLRKNHVMIIKILFFLFLRKQIIWIDICNVRLLWVHMKTFFVYWIIDTNSLFQLLADVNAEEGKSDDHCTVKIVWWTFWSCDLIKLF